MTWVCPLGTASCHHCESTQRLRKMGRKSNLVSRREHSSMQRRLDSILSVHADLELRLHETAKRMRMLQLHSMQSCLKNRWNFHRATSSASFCSVVIGFGFARRFTSTRRPHQAWSVSEEFVRCEQSFTVCRNFWNEAQKAQCPLRRLRRCVCISPSAPFPSLVQFFFVASQLWLAATIVSTLLLLTPMLLVSIGLFIDLFKHDSKCDLFNDVNDNR